MTLDCYSNTHKAISFLFPAAILPSSPFPMTLFHTLRFTLLGALVAGSLSAATLTLSSQTDVIDSFIRSDNTASNTNSNVLLVGELASGAGNLRSLLAFNLSSPDLIGATINSVTLTLRANDIDSGSAGGTMQVNLNLLDSAFTETGATWVSSGTGAWTAGGPYSTLLSSTSGEVKAAVGTTFTFGSTTDFVNAVLSSVSGTGVLNLMLKLDDETTTSRNIFRFTSSEPTTTGGVTSAFAPLLTIDYTAAPVPEPATAALLGGLAVLGLAAVRRRSRQA